MKYRFKPLQSQDESVKIDMTTGEFCAELPDDKTKVIVEYYPAIGKSVVTVSNVLKRAKHCKDADTLAEYLLTPTETVKNRVLTTTDKPTATLTTSAKVDKPTVGTDTDNSVNVTDTVCDDIDDSIAENDYSTVDAETGELFKCRTSKSLHLTWVHVAKEIIASYAWNKCLFITCTMASRPSYDDMNRLATGFINRLKKQFKDEFKGIHKFLEPCDDGSWHVHYIACFHTVPETFDK